MELLRLAVLLWCLWLGWCLDFELVVNLVDYATHLGGVGFFVAAI